VYNIHRAESNFPLYTHLIVVWVLADNLIYSFETLLITSIVLPFRSTSVNPRFLMGFVLLDP